MVMTNNFTSDIDLLKNALVLAHDNHALREKSLRLNSITKQIFYHLETRHLIHDKSFPKNNIIKKMMQNIDSLDDQICSLVIHTIDEDMIKQVKPGVARMEFALFVHRETAKLYNMNKDLFDLLVGAAYWFLHYSRQYRIPLPEADELSELIKNEGFFVNGYQSKSDTEKNHTTKRQNVNVQNLTS